MGRAALMGQGHGKRFEEIVLSRGLGVSLPVPVERLCAHDLPAHLSPCGLALNIKCVSFKRSTGKEQEVCLADALRFWSHSEKVRFIVGFHRQQGSRKLIYKVETFDIDFSDAAQRALLFGSVSAQEISALRDFVKAIPVDAQAALEGTQAASEKIDTDLAPRLGAVQLRRKISRSGSQRRVQCAFSMDKLRALIPVAAHEDAYEGMSLPFTVVAPSRRQQKNLKP